MKATINGISIEGSPEEVLEFQKLQERRMLEKLPKISPNSSADAWWHTMPETVCNNGLRLDGWDGIWRNHIS